ncbi:competence protein CoiA family protein [Dyella sp. 2HG41-7]|uniref:competence protein CoiA n=1 Tax=Dyella sp. 2HG41-7 TaxID=2883239 RepID=UPI001F465626|nr:competence protein CoiA family protein [Dyella sp. 2HG41-7]
MSYVECIEALHVNGGTVNALKMTPAEWRQLQDTYTMGELQMPCCKGSAVPKVSPNGHPFFAHASGACSESEESQWHQAAKHTVRATLEALGCVATLEQPGQGELGRWQADVWGERGDMRIAVEIQRSYQHSRDYLDRQEKYRAAGVRTVWLLRLDRYRTLLMSLAKEKWRADRHNPNLERQGACHPDLPMAILTLDDAGEAKVTGASGFEATLPELLDAVMSDRFLCLEGLWCIDNLDAMKERMRLAREANAAKGPPPARRRRR